jgi:hypothetical protein
MTAILERRESESLWGRFCNCLVRDKKRNNQKERRRSVCSVSVIQVHENRNESKFVVHAKFS